MPRNKWRIVADATKAKEIKFTADVTIEAAAADKSGPRRFNVLAYTGGILPGALRSGNKREDV